MRTFAVIVAGLGALLLVAQMVAAANDALSWPHVLYAAQRPAPPT